MVLVSKIIYYCIDWHWNVLCVIISVASLSIVVLT